MAEDGFLGRWSRRKLDAKAGKVVEATVIPAQAGIHTPALQDPVQSDTPAETSRLDSRLRGNDEEGGEPSPTLDDVQSLTPQSDFSRFVRADVSPEVRNAAVKKLFADPHFNVMDGLDVYIDDYNKTEPLPPSMLRQLASAEFLGLFREEKEGEQDEAAPPAAQPEAKAPPDAEPGTQTRADDNAA